MKRPYSKPTLRGPFAAEKKRFFVRCNNQKGRVGVPHVVSSRLDRTVCGIVFAKIGAHRWRLIGQPTEKLCASCDRMKDAATA